MWYDKTTNGREVNEMMKKALDVDDLIFGQDNSVVPSER